MLENKTFNIYDLNFVLMLVGFSFFTSLKDLVHDGVNGLVVEHISVSRCINVLSKLMMNLSEITRMSHNSYLFLDKYNKHVIMNMWNQTFNYYVK